MRLHAPYRALGALVIFGAAAWSGYAILADAPVVDESPHLAAGISYVQLLDYRLNPEHPPLEKLAAGLVASLARPTLPTDAPWWQDGINEQWRAGDAVLWDGLNDPGIVLALGRIGVTLLNFALLIAGWRAIARRWGEDWALAFLTLTATSPFFLGHAHLVTTDIAAAGTAVLACWAFSAYLARRDAKHFALAAGAFGVAQLAKFSLALLVPTFAIAALLLAWRSHGRAVLRVGRALAGPALVVLAGFALVVAPTYAILTWNGTPQRTHRDAEFLLGSFAGGERQDPICSPARCVANLTVAASGYRLTRPLATYALGVLMVAQRSAGGNTIWFDGTVGSSGSKAYFPLVYATKETLPALLLVAVGLALLLRALSGSWRQVGAKATPELVLGIFAALYLASTFRSSLNIGIRHLFPVVPIAYLAALGAWRAAALRDKRYAYAVAVLVALHAGAGILSLPYPLASYNALAGGTQDGYRVAADSNYDWGQDALRLRGWVDAHPEAGRVAVDLFGGSDAQALIGPRATTWWSAKGDPAAYGIDWIAISSNRLLTATGRLVPGEPRFAIDEYRWLAASRGAPYGTLPEPDARAGTSIFLYKVAK